MPRGGRYVKGCKCAISKGDVQRFAEHGRAAGAREWRYVAKFAFLSSVLELRDACTPVGNAASVTAGRPSYHRIACLLEPVYSSIAPAVHDAAISTNMHDDDALADGGVNRAVWEALYLRACALLKTGEFRTAASCFLACAHRRRYRPADAVTMAAMCLYCEVRGCVKM